jgi:hypothetical protein
LVVKPSDARLNYPTTEGQWVSLALCLGVSSCFGLLPNFVCVQLLGCPESSSLTRRKVCRQTVSIHHHVSCFLLYLCFLSGMLRIHKAYSLHKQSIFYVCTDVVYASPGPVKQIESYLSELKLYLQFESS